MSQILIPLIMAGMLAGVVVVLSPTIEVKRECAAGWQTEVTRD